MGGEPRWGKMGKKNDICKPNNAAVVINNINTAKKSGSAKTGSYYYVTALL